MIYDELLIMDTELDEFMDEMRNSLIEDLEKLLEDDDCSAQDVLNLLQDYGIRI